jgi:hypothetical protein
MTPRILALVASLLVLARADAANFAVTTTADGVDATINGICDTGTGACTLRAALQEANAASDPDTITVPGGVYLLSVPDGDDGNIDLDLANPVTIVGAGPLATIVDAQGGGRVFDVSASATISQLTIRGADNEVYGGGILAFPETTLSLTVQDAQITANRAIHGGAVLVAGANVLLERVSITENTGTTSGGALEIASEFGGGTVTLRNSTVSGNIGQKAILNEDQLQLDHVTVFDDTISTSLATTTVARSILDAGTGTMCDGAIVSQGNNIEHGTSCALAMPGDMGGVDPMLGPLQDNGGGTLTHAIPVTSPAVDAAGPCALTEDQRGTPRPLDGNSDGTVACDIGAYELDPADVPTTTTTSTPPGTATTTTTLPAGCPSAVTFAAVRCRVDALADRVTGAGTGSFRDKIVGSIGKARGKLDAAEGLSSSSAKKAKKQLKKAAALVKKARTKIGSKKGQKTFTDATERAALQSDADAARTAILSLMGSLG